MKPTGSLRAMRAAASPLDLDTEALRLPDPEPYQRHVDRTGPPPEEAARGLGALLAWCAERGYPGPEAVGHATLYADSLWLKRLFPRERRYRNAVAARLVLAATKLADPQATKAFPPSNAPLVIEAQSEWQKDGGAFLAEACKETQRRLMMAARRAANGAH